MPIWTTYLGFLNQHKDTANRLGSCFVYYVMRKRGNNEVAPVTFGLIQAGKDKQWDVYEALYARYLKTRKAVCWMQQRADEAKIGNILLVCYEKDSAHCHRRLLAETIVKCFHVEYKGEVTEKDLGDPEG